MNRLFDYVDFLDLLRQCLGLCALPLEAPPQPHAPFSLDGGVTYLTTKEWQQRLGLTKQGVLYRRARAHGAPPRVDSRAATAAAEPGAISRRA